MGGERGLCCLGRKKRSRVSASWISYHERKKLEITPSCTLPHVRQSEFRLRRLRLRLSPSRTLRRCHSSASADSRICDAQIAISSLPADQHRVSSLGIRPATLVPFHDSSPSGVHHDGMRLASTVAVLGADARATGRDLRSDRFWRIKALRCVHSARRHF